MSYRHIRQAGFASGVTSVCVFDTDTVLDSGESGMGWTNITVYGQMHVITHETIDLEKNINRITQLYRTDNRFLAAILLRNADDYFAFFRILQTLKGRVVHCHSRGFLNTELLQYFL